MDKGKGKIEDEDEDDPPKNPKFKGEGSTSKEESSDYEKVITYADYEEDDPNQGAQHDWAYWSDDSWDWRSIDGIVGTTLQQGRQATCWACAVVRSVEALYNIGLGLQRNHRSLSIQHLVNNVNFDAKDGIGNTRKAFAYVQKQGLCTSSQCRQQGNVVERSTCRHGQVHCYDIDDYVTIRNVDDIALKEIVRQQPVVAVLPLTRALQIYGTNPNDRIYNAQPDPNEPRQAYHVVLIVGYGDYNGRPHWIIQNSWGEAWGFERGFGYVYRQTKGNRPSLFTEIHYPKRDGA